ncbi:MAG: hypothetical protein Q4C02_05630 [Eubacteriales bacterium]|nr:hypothetical protein [Lachnospiraceae bacterium]MDO4417746.1 hypothetical protein [Eubacteriales bacterium]
MTDTDRESLSIRRVLEKSGMDLSDSVYEESAMADFPVSASGEWRLKKENLEDSEYGRIVRYRTGKKTLSERNGAEDIGRRMDAISEEMHHMLEEGGSREDPDFIALGRQKKALRKERKTFLDRASEEACYSLFGKALPEGNLYSCCFHDSLHALSLDEVLEVRDGLQTDAYAFMAERPWFTGSLHSLRKVFTGGEKVGVEGGPCLFGTDEMRFSFTMKNGSIRRFDYNTRQEILPGREFLAGTTMELFDFMAKECGNVAAASLDCPKKSITVEEYEMLKHILLIAKYLDARAVVTIPDFSYDKTFVSLFSGLDCGVYAGLHEAFCRECLRMSDLMIDMTKKLALQYKVDDYVIFHGREKELLDLFYEKREPFCADKYANRFLTSRNGLRDALLDYICMPALPYYLFGIREIVEVNRIDEFYSIQKCKKIHHTAINLNELLFPEKMCRNGRTSGFFAKMEDKDFV